jgi:phosphoglycolate phosphatase
MKKLIIFDFDGTIANTEEASFEVYQLMADQYGVTKLTKAELQTIKKMPLKERIKAQGIPYYMLPKLISESQSKLIQFMEKAMPFDGIPFIIERLKKEKKLIIVSSNHKKIIKSFLKSHHLNHFIKVYGGASLFGKSSMIKKSLKKMKTDTKYALYIGDEIRDYHACQELGLDMVAVSWGYDDKTLLEKEHIEHIADNADHLLMLIKRFDLKGAL